MREGYPSAKMLRVTASEMSNNSDNMNCYKRYETYHNINQENDDYN